LIIGGRSLRGDIIRNLAHAIGHARKPAEELRQLSIHALQNEGNFLFQFLSRVGVKPLSRAQMVGERLEISLEPYLANQFLHFRADSLDFGLAGGVNFFGRQFVERGKLGDAVAVVIAAIGQRRRGNRAAAIRHVFLSHERQELAVARHDTTGNRLARLAA